MPGSRKHRQARVHRPSPRNGHGPLPPAVVTTSAVEFEGKRFPFSADGFVPLEAFSVELFDLSPEDLGSFFDPNDRFYNQYEDLRQGLRHNVHYRTIKNKGASRIVCEGGIHHEDLDEFVRRARMAIDVNNREFDAAIQQARVNVQPQDAKPGSPPVALRIARMLRALAAILRKASSAMRSGSE